MCMRTEGLLALSLLVDSDTAGGIGFCCCQSQAVRKGAGQASQEQACTSKQLNMGVLGRGEEPGVPVGGTQKRRIRAPITLRLLETKQKLFCHAKPLKRY